MIPENTEAGLKEMTKYKLPEPSGQVEWFPNLKNSYGGLGCYRVGNSEIENPVEDVEYHSQMLADSLAALEHENTAKVDALAAVARDNYYNLDSSDYHAWDNLTNEYKDRWRSAVRAVLLNAG